MQIRPHSLLQTEPMRCVRLELILLLQARISPSALFVSSDSRTASACSWGKLVALVSFGVHPLFHASDIATRALFVCLWCTYFVSLGGALLARLMPGTERVCV
jgi:hypothetical protein